MSEVKRYRVLIVIDDNPLNSIWTQVVRAYDFDAQRLRADTAEAELVSANADKEAYAQNAIDLRKRAVAAEQRIADLAEALRYAVRQVPELGTVPGIRAALNPNPNPEAAPEGWVPCSPEWLEAGGDCATAKRWSSKVWDGHSHWHPNPEAESHE